MMVARTMSADWYDNPLFLKCARVQLRRHRLVPTLIALQVIAILIMWAMYLSNSIPYAIHFYLVIQWVLLLLVGTSQVTGAIATTMGSGMIDFHRIAPYPMRRLVLGVLVGAPCREYLFAASLIPYELVCVAAGGMGISQLFNILRAYVLNALMFHSLAMGQELLAPKKNRWRPGGTALVLAIYFFGMGRGTGLDMLTVTPVYREVVAEVVQAQQQNNPGARPNPARGVFGLLAGQVFFFGLPVPAFLLTSIYQIPVLGFALFACTRKMRSERLPAFSKPATLLFLAILLTLMLGSLWGAGGNLPGNLPFNRGTAMTTFTVALGTITTIVLTGMVTPSLGDYVKGIRRARKSGQTRQPPFADHAANPTVMLLLTAIVALAAMVTWFGASGLEPPPLNLFLMTTAALLLIVHFALAWQAALWWYGGRSVNYFGLYLFLVFLVPMFVAALLRSALGTTTATFIAGLSPMASPVLGYAGQGPLQFLGIVNGLLFLVLAVSFYRRAHREIDKVVDDHSGKPLEPSSRYAVEF